MMKKLFALLLAASMLMGFMSIGVSAESWSIPMADAAELSLELDAPATTVTVPISDVVGDHTETFEKTIYSIEAGTTITWPEGYTYMYLECFAQEEDGTYSMYSGGFGKYPGMIEDEVTYPVTCVTTPSEEEDGSLWAENYIYKFTTARLDELGQEYERDITVSVDYIMITEPTASEEAGYAPIELGDYTQALSGKGWSYNPDTVTLTLDNYNLPLPEDGIAEIFFDSAPEDFTISLAPGSVNVMPIVWSGDFKVVGDGSLTMTEYYADLELDCAQFRCTRFYGDELIIRGGDVSFGRTKAVSQITIYDGNVYIGAMDVFNLQILGGDVTANTLTNCNGIGIDSACYEVTGGTLTLERGDSLQDSLFSNVYSTNGSDPDFLTKVKTMLKNMGTCMDSSYNLLEFEYHGENGEYQDGDTFCQVYLADPEGEYPSTIIIKPKSYLATERIDLGDYTVSMSGNGWSYDAATATLTLDGYHYLDYSDIEFDDAPSNFSIWLAEGSENIIAMLTPGEPTVIEGPGSLLVKMNGVGGTLDLNCGSFTCNWTCSDYIIRGGTVNLETVKAVGSFVVYDGTVNVDGLDVYSLDIQGGTVTAGALYNCNGSSIDGSTYQVSGGQLILDGHDFDGEYLFRLTFYKTNDPDCLANVQSMLADLGTCTDAAGNPLHFEYIDYDYAYWVVLADADGNYPSSVVITTNQRFRDVKSTDWYSDAVLWAAEEGITAGYGASGEYFKPDLNCTRAQVVTFLWRAAGSPAPTTAENPFEDVSAGDWYYNAVLWAAENGITAGYGAGGTQFRPDLDCTRTQVVTFLWRAAGSPAPTTAENPFEDVSAGDWYYNAVLWAAENGITAGYGAGGTQFRPDLVCTRGQTVTFLYRAYN